MRAIVIGGAGFIGSNLCERLLAENHEVVCVDNYSLGSDENIRKISANPNFDVIKQDATDWVALGKVFRESRPDYVFHLAANSDIQTSAVKPEVAYRNTYSTTFSVLSAMRNTGVKNVFFASTSAVYGDKKDEVLDENTSNLAPISYYGAAKLGSEALLSAFSYMNDFHSLIFRFPNVIGPNLTHGVIFDFMNKLKADNTKLKILGDGRQTKPYIYAPDLIDAILKFHDVPAGVTVYNVSVEGATSVKTIADIICEEMGLQDVVYEYTGGAGGWKGDVPKYNYNIDKIKKAGWTAKYNSDEAVRMTVRGLLGK